MRGIGVLSVCVTPIYHKSSSKMQNGKRSTSAKSAATFVAFGSASISNKTPLMLEAMIAERKTAVARASTVTPPPEQEYGKGKPGPGRGHKTGRQSTRITGKRDADYLTARIARDRPDILDRMKAGEYLARCMAAVSLPSGARTHEDAPSDEAEGAST